MRSFVLLSNLGPKAPRKSTTYKVLNSLLESYIGSPNNYFSTFFSLHYSLSLSGVTLNQTDTDICFVRRSRVARWFILKPKIPICVNLGVPLIGKC
jgi:hypothetical protein